MDDLRWAQGAAKAAEWAPLASLIGVQMERHASGEEQHCGRGRHGNEGWTERIHTSPPSSHISLPQSVTASSTSSSASSSALSTYSIAPEAQLLHAALLKDHIRPNVAFTNPTPKMLRDLREREAAVRNETGGWELPYAPPKHSVPPP
jgi:hypothetical protein